MISFLLRILSVRGLDYNLIGDYHFLVIKVYLIGDTWSATPWAFRLEEEQLPKLQQFLESFGDFFDSYKNKILDMNLKLYYGGEILTDEGKCLLLSSKTLLEIRNTLRSDSLLALISLMVVFFVLLMNMPLFVAVAGLLQIAITYPTIYFVYRILMGVKYLGILQLVSFFLITGNSVDNFFVIFNFFRQVNEQMFHHNILGSRDYRFKTANGFHL
jgi:hypothetical protein